MCAFASQTLYSMTSAIFKTSEAVVPEIIVTEVAEAAFPQKPSSIKSGPLSIPNANVELTDFDPASLAFSAMSLDSTLATSSAASSMVISNSSESMNTNEVPIISMTEVKEHNSPSDAWMVLYDKVYDVTNFLSSVSFKKLSRNLV